MKAPLISAGALLLCLAALPQAAQPHEMAVSGAVATSSGARIDVESAGIAPSVLRLAMGAVTCATRLGDIEAPSTLTVIDYSLPSVERRLWVFDLTDGTLRFRELVAHGRSEKDIEQLLGCDWLIYQDLPDLEAAVAGPKFPGRKFDSSCFSGEYVTGIEAGYFERIKQLRSDEAKKKRRAS